jgi:hypothetical protein
VVALMDDVEKFEGFYKAKVLGLIKYGGKYSENNMPFWAYEYEREIRNTLGESIIEQDYIQLSEPQVGQPDYYLIINQFVVEGRDIRTDYANTFIDWDRFQSAYHATLTDNVSKRRDFIAAMKEELSGKDGMVSQLMRQAAVANVNAVNVADKDVLDDLVNVTRAIYTKLIEREEAILEDMAKNNQSQPKKNKS